MIFPATMPELAAAKRAQVLQQAEEQGRIAALRGWPRLTTRRARVAASVTRFATRLDAEASRSALLNATRSLPQTANAR